MKDLALDSTFGRLVHMISRGKYLAYDEELDPDIILKYVAVSPTPGPASSVNSRGNKVNLEKDPGIQLIDWVENDPHNPRNWSTPKKLFVTFQICFLATSVYIGSAIYTAGVRDVTEKFEAGEVAALLGLTLFVWGYALGPMVWVGRLATLRKAAAYMVIRTGSDVRNTICRS
jgi:DHA1 family multidrug resistance protein-like MFS transporter